MIQAIREKVWGWRGIIWAVTMTVAVGQYRGWWGGSAWFTAVFLAVSVLLLLIALRKPAKGGRA